MFRDLANKAKLAAQTAQTLATAATTPTQRTKEGGGVSDVSRCFQAVSKRPKSKNRSTSVDFCDLSLYETSRILSMRLLESSRNYCESALGRTATQSENVLERQRRLDTRPKSDEKIRAGTMLEKSASKYIRSPNNMRAGLRGP